MGWLSVKTHANKVIAKVRPTTSALLLHVYRFTPTILEALPFYWLSQALLNILNSAPPHEPGWNVFAPGHVGGGVSYGEMLKSARTFTRMGEGAGMAGLGF